MGQGYMVYLQYLLFRVKVEGESCWPHLVPGKTYWASGLRRPRRGDFMVFHNPAMAGEWYVKRVRAVRGATYEMASIVSWGTSATVGKEGILGTLMGVSAR